jgi:hypothetical protein
VPARVSVSFNLLISVSVSVSQFNVFVLSVVLGVLNYMFRSIYGDSRSQRY